MELEKCVDNFGWTWYMPKLDKDIIDQYGLGTWDLADWVFGTWRSMLGYAFYKINIEFTLLEKVLWRIENFLRLTMWIAYLSNLTIIGRVLNVFRNFVFDIARKVSGD